MTTLWLLYPCLHLALPLWGDNTLEQITATESEKQITFSLGLYQQSYTNDGGSANRLLSPYSIQSALALAYQGAAGSTATEMQRVLGYAADNTAAFHAGYGQAQQQLTARCTAARTPLLVANSLWGNASVSFAPSFLQSTKQYYGGNFKTLDMSDSEKAAQTINDWVNTQTKEQIKDLVPAAVLSAQTELVLVNALYFAGTWATPFDAGRTTAQVFTNADQMAVEVPCMEYEQAGMVLSDAPPYRYTADALGQWLEIPYQGNALSMLVLLPAASLAETVPQLSATHFLAAYEHLAPVRTGLRIVLPKWEAQYTLDATAALRAMGLSAPFSANADFSLLAAPHQAPIRLNTVLHQTRISVTETGTTAAAATSVLTGRGGGEPITFIANRPFLYFIIDKQQTQLLFVGDLSYPS